MKNEFKIIHIFDDDKFVDSTTKLMESVYPNKSKYFVIQSSNEPFNYVTSEIAESVFLITEKDEEKFAKYINDSEIEVVFFHALNPKKQRLTNLINDKIVKVWFVWGYDLYYNWPLLKNKVFQNETKKYFNIKVGLKNKIITNSFTFFLFKHQAFFKLILPNKVIDIINKSFNTTFYKTVKKIDIVVPVIPNEYKLIKKMNINPTLAPFNYVCLEDIIMSNNYETISKSRNILVGNSGDPSNNHLDVFKKIRKYNLKDRKIIVPLSYGGSKDYVEYIIQMGKEYFKSNFVPLVNFLPLEEYNKLISGCGFIIFNHNRQQAVGNIIAFGFLGAKIFLNEKSLVYKYYNSLGIKVYGMSKLNEKGLETNLNSNAVEVNRNLYFEIYSKRAVQNKIKELLNIVNKEQSLKNKINNN